MSESIWWRDEYWWESKSVPLGPLTLSPRQLATLLVAASLGSVASIPVSLPVGGIGFGGKAVVFLVCIVVGYIVSKKRVKMVPVELQLWYMLRNRGEPKQKERNVKSAGLPTGEEGVEEMVVDDFKDATPMTLWGRVKVARPIKLRLVLDGRQVDEVSVSPQAPDYRFVVVPTPQNIGEHDVEVVLEGQKEPLSRLRMVVRKRGVEMLESKK